MKVTVVPYDRCWSQKFLEEKRLISEVLGKQINFIEHIGSTSIPNIHAKPIIDILVSVKDIEKIDQFNNKLEELGYEAKGEFGIKGRRYFTKDVNGERTHQIHIFQKGGAEIAKQLNFRDYLIAHADDANSYSKLKVELSKRFPEDIHSYVNGKEAFVKMINDKAQRWKNRNS